MSFPVDSPESGISRASGVFSLSKSPAVRKKVALNRFARSILPQCLPRALALGALSPRLVGSISSQPIRHEGAGIVAIR